MARIQREKVNVFAGNSADSSDFGVIGSFANGQGVVANSAPPRTDEVAATQGFLAGLKAIVEQGNKLPAMEEFNSLFYAFTRWLKYLYQEGVPEWSAGETYYENSMVKHNGTLYRCTYQTSIDNEPPGMAWGAVKLAPSSVDTSAIQSGAVTTAKIGYGAVTNDRIANSSVDSYKLDLAVTSGYFRATMNANNVYAFKVISFGTNRLVTISINLGFQSDTNDLYASGTLTNIGSASYPKTDVSVSAVANNSGYPNASGIKGIAVFSLTTAGNFTLQFYPLGSSTNNWTYLSTRLTLTYLT